MLQRRTFKVLNIIWGRNFQIRYLSVLFSTSFIHYYYYFLKFPHDMPDEIFLTWKASTHHCQKAISLLRICVRSLPHMLPLLNTEVSNNQENNRYTNDFTAIKMVCYKYQLCIFYYFSGFLNMKDV